jgi:hypothetical protein
MTELQRANEEIRKLRSEVRRLRAHLRYIEAVTNPDGINGTLCQDALRGKPAPRRIAR